MSETPQCLAWLQEHALDESASARAYEAAGPQARSLLKLCIARLHAFWGERPLAEASSRSFSQGFTAARETVPVPYALIFCPVDYEGPARLLAACLPAVFAAVERVIPCFVTRGGFYASAGAAGPLPGDSLLAALELAGLEQAICVSEAEALAVFSLLHTDLGIGRVLILGESPFGESFALAAHRLGIPAAGCREAPGRPALTLDAAHAGVWIWPDIGPDWFRSSCLRLETSGDSTEDI